MGGYYNYNTHLADGWWGRREFMRSLWRLYGDDRRWVPPYYPLLGRMLRPGDCPHVERQAPVLIHLDALPQRKTAGGYSMAIMEGPVAATALLVDPRRRDGTGYLALLGCANDAETFERLAGVAMEQAAMRGCQRLWGPVGFSPHLSAGMLESHYHHTPPLHSPYNPPYLPEVVAGMMEPAAEGYIYRLPIRDAVTTDGPARIMPATTDQLAGDLLPLLALACPWRELFPQPDAEEAAFLARWLGVWPLMVWAAEVEGEPVGLLVMQADVAGSVARARGGRNPIWRAWLGWRARRPVAGGSGAVARGTAEMARPGDRQADVETCNRCGGAGRVARVDGWPTARETCRCRIPQEPGGLGVTEGRAVRNGALGG